MPLPDTSANELYARLFEAQFETLKTELLALRREFTPTLKRIESALESKADKQAVDALQQAVTILQQSSLIESAKNQERREAQTARWTRRERFLGFVAAIGGAGGITALVTLFSHHHP